MAFFPLEHLPVDYEHGWHHIGATNPWSVPEGVIQTREFFWTYYFAYMEKGSCGGHGEQLHTNLRYLVQRPFDILDRTYINLMYQSIVRAIGNLFFDYMWLNHEFYNQQSFDDWWIYSRDSMLYTKTDLEEYVGPKYYELFLAFNEFRSPIGEYWDGAPHIWEYEDPELWNALGKVLWLCTYRVIEIDSFSTSIQKPDKYEFNVDLGAYIAGASSIPKNPRIGDKFISSGDYTYDERLIDPKTGNEIIRTHEWKENRLYEWVDQTPTDRKYGELVDRRWHEVAPSEGDWAFRSNSNASPTRFDGDKWKSWPAGGKLPNPYNVEITYMPCDLVNNEFGEDWEVRGLQIDRVNNPINEGPEDIDGVINEVLSHLGDPWINPDELITDSRTFHVEEHVMEWSKGFSQKIKNFEPVDETQSWRNQVYYEHRQDATGAGMGIYCTDIEGTPLLGDMIYQMSILNNDHRTEILEARSDINEGGYGKRDVYNSPVYDDFPFVGRLYERVDDLNFRYYMVPEEGELLWQFNLTRTMDDNGFTLIKPNLGAIGERFGKQQMFDEYTKPIEPPDPLDGDTISSSNFTDTAYSYFRIDRSRVAPIGVANPDRVQRPIFINTNLPDAKYYINVEEEPEKWQDPEEGNPQP